MEKSAKSAAVARDKARVIFLSEREFVGVPSLSIYVQIISNGSEKNNGYKLKE